MRNLWKACSLLVLSFASVRSAHAVRVQIDPIPRSGAVSPYSPALAKLVPPDEGRCPARRIPVSERYALRKAVDAVFADKSWVARRRILRRFASSVSATRPIETDPARAGAQIIDLIGDSVERAIEAHRGQDAAGARRAVIDALVGVGWAYRMAGMVEASDEDVSMLKRRVFWAGAAATQLGLILVFRGSPSPSAREFFGFLGLVADGFFNIFLTADAFTGCEFVDALSAPLNFVRSSAATYGVAAEIDELWFSLDKRLSRGEEWRVWVKARARRAGAESVAEDFREFLKALVGAKSLGPVCDELLAPGTLASPF